MTIRARRGGWSGIWAPMAVAALLRLGLMLAAWLRTGTAVMTQGDTSSYLEPGRSLILHGYFANGGLAEIDRTPGYPIFAMLAGMLSGNVLLAVTVQIVLSVGSVALLGRIADHVFPDRSAGVVAAWLFACEPISIVYSVRLMPETLYVFLLFLTIERALAFQVRGKLAAVAAASVALVPATFVRPVSYYLFPALALGLVFTAPRFGGLRWKAPVLLLVIAIPSLAAWQVRNWIETGYGGFSSIVEKNLYFFQSAEVTAETRQVSLGTVQKGLGYPDEASYLAAHPEQRTWGQAARLRFMRSYAMEILSRHPWLYLRSHLAGVGVVAFTPCAAEWLQLLGVYPKEPAMPRRILNEGLLGSARYVLLEHPAMAAWMVLLEVYLLVLYGLAIRGLFAGGGSKKMLLTLAGVALYFLLISGGAQAVGRYRLPVMGELCVLAAGGLVTLCRTQVSKSRPGAPEL